MKHSFLITFPYKQLQYSGCIIQWQWGRGGPVWSPGRSRKKAVLPRIIQYIFKTVGIKRHESIPSFPSFSSIYASLYLRVPRALHQAEACQRGKKLERNSEYVSNQVGLLFLIGTFFIMMATLQGSLPGS